VLILSALEASTEEGSSGDSPPFGDAMVIWHWDFRTSYGCANSGYQRGDVRRASWRIARSIELRNLGEGKLWWCDPTYKIPASGLTCIAHLAMGSKDKEDFGCHGVYFS
jgi:hypothetical protein